MLITTTHGEMDDSLLMKREGPGWVEYYLDGELVHRSATVAVTGVQATGFAADLPGSAKPTAAKIVGWKFQQYRPC